MEINLDNYVTIPLEKIKDYKEVILKDKIEIISKNENGVVNVIPYNKIDYLFNNNLEKNTLFAGSKYYIYKSYLDMIEFFIDPNELNSKDYFYSIFTNCKDPIENTEKAQEAILENILSMNEYQRVENIKNLIIELEIEENRDKFTCKAAKLVGEILIRLGLMIRINVIGNISENTESHRNIYESKKYNTNYEELMKSIAESAFVLLNKNYEKEDMFSDVIGFTGCNIIDHSNRLFINTIEFMIFYNKNISMGMLSKIRAKWKNDYMPYYIKISKKNKFIKDISKLDNIFKLGIRQFDYSEIVNMSIAALLHDITLTEIINYLPTENININNELYSHSIKSYNYIKYSISNNQDINLAVGVHHEYYGYGHGLSITLCEAMKSKRPHFEYPYLISFDSKDIFNFTAFIYYPVKIIEILDLYDFLKYKHDICINEINTDLEIVDYMYDNFLKDEVKIDYIIFSIFKNYLSDMKTFN
ncbi:hypothetical protein JQ824_02920 [Brachyspira hyodysenteriae]|uniref:Uncharacterized protein n=1 Tax=Brachyspira hyodysenteriae (strain ATCC 49526 / WA1) TaxID=565034 RepID=A0A3B6VAV1_BRAHW|nr:hypothetical protein [Brachyspira hyodysenteriae]ACN82813.1 hypothetical protein BHWA1_00313 [Brachyspira hyodysenteriae WA1]KLI15411.1 hypothetical protein SU44_08795 [Brachyspira hyodysenteriae]KLI17547.1 hypothetical protein SU45_04890 [Brachyspira hyodysenteriae]KLI20857.1 hypothetical protein SU43_11355 [Brachyspira hyodysenteriae]KLI21428.1 hypothetical protein SU46_02085 [Brachyspira hyodysenteriae]